MKKCNRCKLDKGLSEFAKGSGRCRPCQAVMAREHYLNNKEVYVKSAIDMKNRNHKYILEYLKNHPCVVCGEDDPIVLDFDHLKDKTASVTQAVIDKWSLQKIDNEIKKCQVLCANCHRRKTAKERNSYRYRENV